MNEYFVCPTCKTILNVFSEEYAICLECGDVNEITNCETISIEDNHAEYELLSEEVA